MISGLGGLGFSLTGSLKISFSGENTQFIRFSQSKIRQTGLVDDISLEIQLIYNNRICSEALSVSGNMNIDIQNAKSILDKLRIEVIQLPVDPYIVLPENNHNHIISIYYKYSQLLWQRFLCRLSSINP